MTMIKHFLNYFLFACTMFAAGAAPLGGGSGAGAASGSSGAGAGTSPAGAGSSGAGTSDSGAGSPGSQAQPGAQGGQQVDGLRQLRETYETLKKEYEPWQKLGVKPEQVTQFQTVYQKTFEAAASIGRELGYPDEEIQEALAEDPQKTLDFLRNEAQRMQQGGNQRGGDQNLQDLVAQHIEQAIGPIQQRENLRITNEANALFERTVHQLAAEAFKTEGIDIAKAPQDELFMLTSVVSEILKYDPDALKALKYEGKTAAIQKAFTEACTMLDKYYLARSGRDRDRLQPAGRGQQQPGQQQQGKRPSLDEMIDNPELIDQAQGRSGANAHYR